jgi:hypothetical protein
MKIIAPSFSLVARFESSVKLPVFLALHNFKETNVYLTKTICLLIGGGQTVDVFEVLKVNRDGCAWRLLYLLDLSFCLCAALL